MVPYVTIQKKKKIEMCEDITHDFCFKYTCHFSTLANYNFYFNYLKHNPAEVAKLNGICYERKMNVLEGRTPYNNDDHYLSGI